MHLSDFSYQLPASLIAQTELLVDHIEAEDRALCKVRVSKALKPWRRERDLRGG